VAVLPTCLLCFVIICTGDVRAAVLGSSLTPAMLAAPQSATTALDCWKVMFASVKAAQEIGPNDVTLTLGPPMGTRGSTRWCNDNRFLSGKEVG
jgi:hypothetical protein